MPLLRLVTGRGGGGGGTPTASTAVLLAVPLEPVQFTRKTSLRGDVPTLTLAVTWLLAGVPKVVPAAPPVTLQLLTFCGVQRSTTGPDCTSRSGVTLRVTLAGPPTGVPPLINSGALSGAQSVGPESGPIAAAARRPLIEPSALVGTVTRTELPENCVGSARSCASSVLNRKPCVSVASAATAT